MSRLPLYLALAVALCFGASASFATPIRIVLAAGDSMDTTPTPTVDLGVEEDDEEVFIVTETRSNGVVEMATATGSTGPRNQNILRTSQGQSAGVALTLGRAIDNNLDDSSRGRSRLARVASGPSNAASPYNEGEKNEGGEGLPPEEPPHMPEPTAAALFALGVWVAGRRFRR